MSQNDGGPAFPITSFSAYLGMSLRDYFAGQAVAGGFDARIGLGWNREMIAGWAYQLADAMLAERAKSKQE